MQTCRSPLELFHRAYELGCRVWSDFDSPFSRQDFTRPQLFACLVLRESLQLSYRRAEAFLADVPDWLASIGMTAVPDHNTLWRAFGTLLRAGEIGRALDWMADGQRSGVSGKPLTIDSTCYEPRHRSRHYDRVCRKRSRQDLPDGQKRPGSHGKSVNASRSKALREMPKLALAAAAASHRILAALASIGLGSDAPDFAPLLKGARRRARFKTVVADAGYDSEANHVFARRGLSVRSIIPPKIGRPSQSSPSGYYRGLMKSRFNRKADAATYGQRSQSETVNSMMKRNLGESLRSIRPERQKQELLLRALTHNLMLGQTTRDRD
jgi:hypothetical protein